MIRTIGVTLTLGCLSAIASAQNSPDPLDACVKQTDATARLACFDHEMQRRHATPPAAPVAAATAAASADPKHSDENVGLEGKQLHKKLKEQGVQSKPEPVKPIVSTIARLIPRPDNEYAFELDNGQTWEQAESKSGLNVNPHDPVTIEPGVLGAFFLTTKTHQRVRVHRVR